MVREKLDFRAEGLGLLTAQALGPETASFLVSNPGLSSVTGSFALAWVTDDRGQARAGHKKNGFQGRRPGSFDSPGKSEGACD